MDQSVNGAASKDLVGYLHQQIGNEDGMVSKIAFDALADLGLELGPVDDGYTSHLAAGTACGGDKD